MKKLQERVSIDWKTKTKLLSDREVNKGLRTNSSPLATVLNGPLQLMLDIVILISAVHTPQGEIFLHFFYYIYCLILIRKRTIVKYCVNTTNKTHLPELKPYVESSIWVTVDLESHRLPLKQQARHNS